MKYMSYKKLPIICILFCCLLLGACKKEWFDKKPYNNILVPSTVSDLSLILDNTDLNSNSPVLNIIGSDEIVVSETDWKRPLFDLDRNAYTWTNDLPYVSVQDWNAAYSRIFNANIVLDGIKKIEPLNAKEELNLVRIKGDALFHRAKSFFELAMIYAPPYMLNSGSNEMGIPLRLSSDVTIKSARATLKETYDQIISDLKLAKQLVPIIPEYKTRSSKAAVFGLLARVNLTIGNYDSAFVFADSCLNYSHVLIDYNTISQSSDYSFPAFPSNNSEIIFYNRMHGSTQIARSDLYGRVPAEIYDEYAENDLRKNLFFKKLPDGSIQFKGSYTGDQIMFGGLATDEIYFIRAECAARKNDLESAIKDLNILLRSRWASNTYVDQVVSDKKTVLELIIKERKKELVWRGTAWTDLRRLNLEENFKKSVKHTIGEKVLWLEPNSYKYTFPIPQDVIDLAPSIKQFPGWEK